MRFLIIGLLLVFLGLQYKLWFGDGSLLQWRALKKELAVEKKENARLKSRNLVLEADIRELKSGAQALEEQARSELGMIKESERYYQFVE